MVCFPAPMCIFQKDKKMFSKKTVASAFLEHLEAQKSKISAGVEAQIEALEGCLAGNDDLSVVHVAVGTAIVFNGKPYALDHSDADTDAIVEEAAMLFSYEIDIAEDSTGSVRCLRIGVPMPNPAVILEFLDKKKDILVEALIRSFNEDDSPRQ